MPIRLDTVLKKVERMSNTVNSDLLEDFYEHMKDNGTSQNYQKGNLKAMVHFAEHIGAATSFYDVDQKQVMRFLDTKIKSEQIDSDKKWITTWNDYLWRLKLFFRWLHNRNVREINGEKQPCCCCFLAIFSITADDMTTAIRSLRELSKFCHCSMLAYNN
jgi:integrase/recombinase XerD